MKKTLKELRQLADTAKKAWLDARKAKKDATEIKAASDEYNRLQNLVNEAEADGKKDADEIEVPEAKSNEMTIDEVKTIVMDSVKQVFATEMPKIKVDEAALQSAINAQLKSLKGDSATITNADVQAAAKAAITAYLDAHRKPAVNTKDPADANHDRAVIRDDAPCSGRKGNLPLHMKQLSNVLLRRPINEGIDKADLEKGEKHADKLWMGMKSIGAKALTSDGDGTGAEWVPRNLSSELYRRMYLDSQIAQAFLAQEVDMPTDPYDYPLLTTDPTFYINSVENTDGTASEVGTGEFTLTTKTLMALVQFSYKADEDSIVPILPTLQMSLGRAGARALEQAILNGDTTSTHQDSDITNAKDVAKAWKGWRKLSLAVSALKVDLSTGGLSRANLLSVLKLLGKYGVRTQDILWVVGPKAWNALLGLDEVALAYARGAAGTYTSGGPTPAPWGGQIVVSEQMRENLNASGVYDGSTTTKGAIIAVNKAGFVLGSRREFMVEVEKNIRSQTHEVVASFRKAFQPVETPSATVPTVAIGYNYTA